jgi:hypothetical protein
LLIEHRFLDDRIRLIDKKLKSFHTPNSGIMGSPSEIVISQDGICFRESLCNLSGDQELEHKWITIYLEKQLTKCIIILENSRSNENSHRVKFDIFSYYSELMANAKKNNQQSE